ncbi:MAG: translocation/assembly module TamB domain-containing protein [Oceanococcus sp.]
MTRWLLYRFAPFYFLLISTLVGLMLLSSETGLNWLWQRAQSYIPEHLQIERLQGRLLGHIQISGLQYRDESMSLHIEQLLFDWSPWALLEGQLGIQDISIVGVRYEQYNTAQEPETKTPLPDTLPKLFNIALNQARIRKLLIVKDNKNVFQLNSAAFKGNIRGNKLRLEISQWDAVETGSWQATLDAKLRQQDFTIHELMLSSPNYDRLSLKLAGQCAWPSLLCSAAVDWEHLRWPLHQPQFSSQRGSIQANNTQAEPIIHIAADLQGVQLPKSEISAQARLPMGKKQWALKANWQALGTTKTQESAQLEVVGQYQIDSTEFDAQIQFKALDLSWWLADWPSELDGKLALDGAFWQSLRLNSKHAEVHGSLRGQAFRTQLSGQWKDMKDWSLPQAKIEWAGNQLTASLRRRSTWNGAVSVKAPRLDKLDPQFSGALTAQVALSGTRDIPDARWVIDGEELQLGDLSLAKINSEGQFSDSNLSLSLIAKELIGQGLQLSKFQLKAQGSPAHADAEIVVQEARGEGRIALVSRWQQKQQQLDLQLQSGEWQLGPAPRMQKHAWALASGGNIQWLAGKLRVEPQCWSSQKSSSCLQAQWDGENLSGEYSLDAYRLSRLQTQLPEGSQLRGDANIKLVIAPSPLQQLQSNLTLNTSAINLSIIQGEDRIPALHLFPGQLQAEFQGTQGQAHWDFPTHSDERKGLYGNVRIAEKGELSGRINVLLDDLTLVSALSSEVLQSSGKLDGQFQLAGQLDAPQITGQMAIDDGQLDLDRPNLQIKQVQMKFVSNQQQGLQLVGSAQSGEGSLSVEGQWQWLAPKSPLSLSLKGENFLAVDTADAKILISPDLKLQAELPDIRLSGRITIPQAQIQPRELNQRSAVAVDADQVIVGAKRNIEQALQITSSVELVLGEDVEFEGLGLTSDLRGRLSTRMKPGQVATGTGELSLVNGRYKAYGQDLRIERGKLIFSGGPLTEPGLDIKAFRQATADIRAGVVVRGPIKKPLVSLYSQPNMRETDQLSYLVLGRAAEAENDNDQAALNNAALALGLKGSDFLAKRFKTKLGLDEVSIGTQPGESSTQASLVLGKYLNPDIYISYGIGLFEPIYTFKLRYRLSQSWSLQTESGIESGGDLFFTIER